MASLQQLSLPHCVSMAALQQLAHPHCVPCASSCSMMFTGGRVRTRFSPSPLRKSGCQWTRRQSGSGGNICFAIVPAATIDQIVDKVDKETDVELLACPLCFRPLSRNGIPGLGQQAISASEFQCDQCKKSYPNSDSYIDLTITANAKEYSEERPIGIELFRSPLISFAYERGWRQMFGTYGFPGLEEEVKMAEEYLKPTFGGVLLDVGCGSGLFARKFANLGWFSAVLAIDFSENMLRQAYEYMKDDAALFEKSLGLVRADAARMPFATGSVGAVFAGASLQCWPSPAAGVAEISRVLRPGGVFVATTVINIPLLLPLISPEDILYQFLQSIPQRGSGGFRFLRESELDDVVKMCGLVNYRKIKRGRFIMLIAEKAQ